MFRLISKDKKTKARRGVITTDHGVIESPFFMPVGTNGTVKTLTFEDLEQIKAQIVLSNTYHLYLRPGMEIIEKAGGLHQFIGWDKPMLTDSGGYQVFSLSKLRNLREDGVCFQSHLDGTKHLFTPEKVIDIEIAFGTDMMMPLDVCAPYPCKEKDAEQAVERTTQWAKRSKEHFLKMKRKNQNQYLFGIIQGATYKDLREKSAKEILEIGFAGYAIGGVSVGEPVREMFKALEWVEPYLPKGKPRYFMGIGLPDQIVKAVAEGVDMFDTCLPTRYGRHGAAFTKKGKMNINNAEYEKDLKVLDDSCDCFVCKKYSRSYIRHMIKSNEITGLKLLTFHNLYFYVKLMRSIRCAIKDENYEAFCEEFLSEYNSDILEFV